MNTCPICNKNLATCESIYAAGLLFCSKKCGKVYFKHSGIYTSARKAAKAFNELVEEVSPREIGIYE